MTAPVGDDDKGPLGGAWPWVATFALVVSVGAMLGVMILLAGVVYQTVANNS